MEGYKHILIPLDGSECSERAMLEGERLQQAFGSTITLLYVVSDPDLDIAMGSPAAASTNVQKECAEGERYLKARAQEFPGEAETKVVVGNVAKSILQACEELECDLIVMGSQGLGSALRRFLVGSVAKNVLSNANVPVLIAH